MGRHQTKRSDGRWTSSHHHSHIADDLPSILLTFTSIHHSFSHVNDSHYIEEKLSNAVGALVLRCRSIDFCLRWIFNQVGRRTSKTNSLCDGRSHR